MALHEWKLENNLISLSIGENEYYYPTSKELYSCKDQSIFNYGELELPSPFSILNIRFSKFGLNTNCSIKYADGKIFLCCFAYKNETEIPIKTSKKRITDYVIYNQTGYFLNGIVPAVCEILEAINISDVSNIQYTEYMSLKKALLEKGISISDEVQDAVKNSIPSENRTIGLKAKLYEYQKKGFSWLKFMSEMNCGCILGDEMGLGKTLQVIALFGFILEHKSNIHFLVVAPVSLLENWKREINKFYPSMKVLVHHGSARTGKYTDFLDYDVVITSYSNAQSDLSVLNMIKWDQVVLDEAQNIKNPYAKRTTAMKMLNRKMGIAVTGTPFENHMTDIWSLMDFIIPDYFGTVGEFERVFTDTIDAAEAIESFISPVMLRRRVKDVAKDLPDRIDIPHPIIMTHEEAVYYDDGHKEMDKDPNLKDLSIDKIQRLRMFCTHPMVYNKDLRVTDPKQVSTKYELLCELLEEIVASEEKSIIFTSFNKMNDLLVDDLKNRFNIYTNCINGATRVEDRQNIIDEFSNIKGPAVLVLNPKAAGTGLNITAANHVIHYNLEWNPALEDQASARAYRRGQEKTVFIHRLFYVNTIEEVINERIQLKRDLSDAAVIGNQGESNNSKDLLRALSLSPLDCF